MAKRWSLGDLSHGNLVAPPYPGQPPSPPSFRWIELGAGCLEKSLRLLLNVRGRCVVFLSFLLDAAITVIVVATTTITSRWPPKAPATLRSLISTPRCPAATTMTAIGCGRTGQPSSSRRRQPPSPPASPPSVHSL